MEEFSYNEIHFFILDISNISLYNQYKLKEAQHENI